MPVSPVFAGAVSVIVPSIVNVDVVTNDVNGIKDWWWRRCVEAVSLSVVGFTVTDEVLSR